MTQIEHARAGRVTPEIEAVARDEQLDPGVVRDEVARGRMVIAANKAHDYRERQNAAKRGGGLRPVSLQAEDAETGLTLDPPSTQPGPDTTLMRSERLASVDQALTQLGDPCREILELRYFADLSYEEISASLDLNPKTVSSRLSKCLDKLEVILRDTLLREENTGTSVQ